MKDKDFLEKIIEEKMDELDIAEPREGHFERFRERLEKEKENGVKGFNWRNLWKVAAVVVFVFLAGNQVRMWISTGESKQVSLGSISPEYAEVEFYYTGAITSGLDNLNTLAANGIIPGEEIRIMQQEFDEFENRFDALKEELKANPDDERIINAMIGHYQAKLNVINMILNKLQEVKQKNNESHETEI